LRILDLLADGRTRAEVAAQLRISPNSVGTYLTRMGRKLEHHSQSAMVGYCYREGLFRRHPSPMVLLSARGTWLVCMVAEGRSNQEIADASGVTLDTAKYQVRVVMHTLDARSRPHVVRRAVDAGALPPAWWGGAR
jgi:DNA-binding CsgD family transcriptional regulator